MSTTSVKQFLNGEWIELIELSNENATTEDIEENLKKLKDIIFDSDKVTLYTQTEAVIFSRLDGPVKIEIKYQI